MELDFPTVQLVIVVVIILLATLANKTRGGENTGAMIFGLAFLSAPALFAAAAYGWPGFVWGSIGTLILMRLLR